METIRRRLSYIDWGKLFAFIYILYLSLFAMTVSSICFVSLQGTGVPFLGLSYSLVTTALISTIMTLAIESGGKGFVCFFADSLSKSFL